MEKPKQIIDEETKAAIERGDIRVLPDGNWMVKNEYYITMQKNIIRIQSECIEYQKKQIQSLKKHLNLFVCNSN